MAMSNRDRVGRGIELLAEGLAPFVDAQMSAASPSRDWVTTYESRDKRGVKYSKTDPQFLLRVITEERAAFRDRLSRTEQAFALELRERRNSWAHNETFSSSDTRRVLETMELLLGAIGATSQADQVRVLRMESARAAFESDVRKETKAAVIGPAIEGLGLKPWRETIAPHVDVRSGNYSASEFAADLYMVAHGKASQEYSDPVEFFRRTYLTEGLRDLLGRAMRRIGGDPNASPIVNLQTNFGGGKTHSMLALWHLFAPLRLADYPQEVQDLLAGEHLGDRKLTTDGFDTLSRSVRRVALVGNHLPPSGLPAKDDGTVVRTLWGELAWQLGGRAGYDLVAEADQTSTNPGASLRTLVAQYAPCLILVDEWVAYARQLYGRDELAGGTFDTQFTFAQTLTEVVKSVPGAMLVISIPASHNPSDDGDDTGGSALEVGGLNGREALARLQHVVRRVADQWRPASSHESFEIVRRRLFEDPDSAARADIHAVARAFVEFYGKHRGEFPRGCADVAYEQRIRAAYPIHPEVFDRLYSDWSTLDRFQRTRGVLRLMSAVIHELWSAGDAAPLIMPGAVPLAAELVRSELTQYLDDDFKPIIDADIDGTTSTPFQIDQERSTFGARALTRRLARAVFLGSAATLKTPHKGVERQHVWLGVAVPGDTVGNFGSALQLLSDRATYLYSDGDRYWYDTQASITRTAKDIAERLRGRPEEAWAEICRRLRQHEIRARGHFAAVQAAPDDPAEIPDLPEARLVIIHPRHVHRRTDADSAAHRFARAALDKRGPTNRTNKNLLVFLAADAKRAEELSDAVCEYLAWSNIVDRAEELSLSLQQQRQAASRKAAADQTVSLRVTGAFVWAIVPVQPQPDRPIQWEVIKADGAKERLAERTSDKLATSDLIRIVHNSRLIRADLDQKLTRIWQQDKHIQAGELWDYYRQYPYLARMRDRSVFDHGVQGVLEQTNWDTEGFALATGYDPATKRYTGLILPTEGTFGPITDTTLLVHPAQAFRQREQERIERAQRVLGGNTGGPTVVPDPQPEPHPPDDQTHPGPTRPSNVRFFGSYPVDPERYARDFGRVAQEIIAHLAGAGVNLEIRVEIAAHNPEGFGEDKIRTVTENARTLKFTQYGFENR